jgi:hypothetical protein
LPASRSISKPKPLPPAYSAEMRVMTRNFAGNVTQV